MIMYKSVESVENLLGYDPLPIMAPAKFLADFKRSLVLTWVEFRNLALGLMFVSVLATSLCIYFKLFLTVGWPHDLILFIMHLLITPLVALIMTFETISGLGPGLVMGYGFYLVLKLFYNSKPDFFEKRCLSPLLIAFGLTSFSLFVYYAYCRIIPLNNLSLAQLGRFNEIIGLVNIVALPLQYLAWQKRSSGLLKASVRFIVAVNMAMVLLCGLKTDFLG